LEDLFAEVSDRFAEIYREINPDEGTFDPLHTQTNTGVEFSVDFYGDETHPPSALHSEEHQDLMGVCLFLALADELSPLERTPILLDDVVMSVDATHRQRVAEVLATTFSDQFQFFLTAHDSTWATQLAEAGVPGPSNLIRFSDWSLEAGPE
jgi:hypothetical protein